jgi:integrase
VITPENERAYLERAREPVKSIASVLADSGLRPGECYRGRWEDMNWRVGRYGIWNVTHGKTPSARRIIPMTPRVRFILETRWELAGKPDEGWIWPAPTKTGHIDHSSLKKQHIAAFRSANSAVKKRNEENQTKENELQPWVLYSFRHTFLTRLGESGCDAWTLARIAGHSSIAISSRYVHPSQDAVLTAMSRLGGHIIGHSEERAENPPVKRVPQIVAGIEEEWCARRDSNSRPNAPEAFALSS